MTPQEQQLVADLFDRLASLEDQRRDPDAERLIREGLGRAPNGVYALVQSVLVQDEALKRANARIEEFERALAGHASAQPQQGGFLDSMRNMLGRGSVPSVRAGGQGSSGVWGSGPAAGYQQQVYPQGYQPVYAPASMMGGGLGGGSFLGTAAAAAAGVVGGSLLLDGIRSMMGGHHGFGDYAPMGPAHAASPWGGDSIDHGPGAIGGGGSGDLARDAGIDDIGRDHRAPAYDDPGRASFFGGSGDDADDQTDSQATDDYDDGGGDGGGDFGGDFGGDDSA
jgi:hypothetical protein